MLNYSFYSAILGLSSSWRITNVTVDEQSGNIELHIHNAHSGSFTCSECGACILPKGNRKGRWSRDSNHKIRFHISAIIPLVSCESCGEMKIQLPWEQSGFRNEECLDEHPVAGCYPGMMDGCHE